MNNLRRNTYYEILGSHPNEDPKSLELRYISEVQFFQKLWESGISEAKEKVLELTKAYETLSDPEKKAKYDSEMDFEFVLLDGKTKDPEMEEAYDIYRTTHNKSYKQILGEFSRFKNELSDTLWKLKQTSIYLVANLILYSLLVIVISILETSFPNQFVIYEKLRPFPNLLFLLFSFLGYQVFKFKYLFPELIKRKSLRQKQEEIT
ncbi:MAG: molecular chaperone DnaJ [Leptospira sp.]|jgi:hypothetical protein|nr:molecular chaperone DnaJ [Leptospira sp.]